MPNSRLAAATVIAAMAAFAAGCIDSATTVEIKPDGSGTVTEAVYVTRTMERMLGVMSSMAAALVHVRTNAAPVATGAVDRVMYQERAAAMGAGVRLVSAEKSARRDGLGGVLAVYAFNDIRRLRLPVDPPYPVPDFGAPPTGDTARVTFAFDAGETPALTVTLPWAEAARRSVAARQNSRPTASVSPEESALLRHVLEGFRARLVITSPRGIAGTDATFTEISGEKNPRRSVVLFDIDMGTLARNEGLIEQVAGLGPARDMGDALGRYAGLPGLKIETRASVKVRL